MRVNIPPIKSQGIKTKLVPWIKTVIPKEFNGTWVEPFMGTGVVAFNAAPDNAILCDTNPHLINFYKSLSNRDINPDAIKIFLNMEGGKLHKEGESYYYKVRDRFNKNHSPLDFLFLNRAGFNGMVRFNRNGEFNVPFCKKPQRFAKAYITKIVNQATYIYKLLQVKKFTFKCQPFSQTIFEASPDDIIYCDPPYINRHADYYNGWNFEDENCLYNSLCNSKAKFILSTWHHNDYRENEYIKSLWKNFNILTRKHFYHVGGKEKNRNAITEAIVTNLENINHNELPNLEIAKNNNVTLFENISQYSA